jgi:hypothetical protein
MIQAMSKCKERLLSWELGGRERRREREREREREETGYMWYSSYQVD